MRAVLEPISFWFHDLGSCLHDCLGTVLLYHGRDPILTLGASWEFYHLQSEANREEFYFPPSRPSLGQSMMPFHPVDAAWHQSADPQAAWAEVTATIREGRPVIVAEDNFHVPFRPAWHDVHAAHLLVMYGFDEEADEVHVLDSTPPSFKGAITIADFLAARGSTNPVAGERDFFFAGAPIANRWLHFATGAGWPELTREWVAEVIATNLRGFRAAGDGAGDGAALRGLDGQRRYLAQVCERAAGPEGGRALDEMYTVSWVAQAAAGLHADFLMTAGRRLDWLSLLEIGRQVDALANSWTGLRMLASHGFAEGLDVVDRVAARAAELALQQERVLDLLGRAVKAS